MLTPQQALRVVLSHVRVSKAKSVALDQAVGRCLAESIRNDRDQPPADRSAMDGYAVIAVDLKKSPTQLKLIGEVAAGSSARPRVRRGCCATILTGANIPPGADAVVPIEKTKCHGDVVTFLVPAKPGDCIRRRGEEAKRSQVLLTKGMVLNAAAIGVCAMIGKAQVKVYPSPKVAVLCTGAEVLDVEQRVAKHQLRDSNGPALLAAISDHGFTAARRRILPDESKVIVTQLKRAIKTHDVVIITGGVSVGKYDYVPHAIKTIGGKVRFHGVKMKPGRPQLYATLPDNKHIFGLPGNPVSVLTGFFELTLPALRKLSGFAEKNCQASMHLPLSRPAQAKGDRTTFVLSQLSHSKNGPSVQPLKSTGSADAIAASGADGVIVVPDGIKQLAAGALVEFHPWRRSV